MPWPANPPILTFLPCKKGTVTGNNRKETESRKERLSELFRPFGEPGTPRVERIPTESEATWIKEETPVRDLPEMILRPLDPQSSAAEVGSVPAAG